MCIAKNEIGRLVYLKNKIDFVCFFTVAYANPNGDPADDNRPRTDYDGFGEVTDVCIKRKGRNRLQDNGYNILVKSNERCDDGFYCVRDRAEAALGKPGKGGAAEKEYRKKACETFYDVRAFGHTFMVKGEKKNKKASSGDGDSSDENANGVSLGIRGAISMHIARSVYPVEIEPFQITKSTVNEEKSDRSETMGKKYVVQHGLYVIKGSINPHFSKKNGFTREDVEAFKEALRTLFVNDASAARPDGSMEMKEIYWFEHNCEIGQYSSARVYNSIKVELKNPDEMPKCFDDYKITCTNLDGLVPEIIQGF